MPSSSASASAPSLLARVRSSCEAQLAAPDCTVSVHADRVRALVAEMDWSQFDELSAPQRFPLNFKSLADEINFLTIYGLLNFGSGYRKELHKYCDRGAAETILFGLIGMYISVPNLSAEYLSGLSLDVVANFFSIPLERDEELSPGIYIAKPGPIKPLVVLLHDVLTDCGRRLKEQGHADFGAFVVANLRDSDDEEKRAVDSDDTTTSGDGACARYLVERLVTTFPAFDDHRDSRGQSCWFLKRAQLVVASLHRRFHDSEPTLTFADIDEITALSDNASRWRRRSLGRVLPCVLRAMGILEYAPDVASHIDRGQELPAGDWECDIRAGAVVACDQIVAASDGRIRMLALDTYLWRVGKEPRFRELERHATRDTCFY